MAFQVAERLEIAERLDKTKHDLEELLTILSEVTDPILCKVEGMVESAKVAIASAAELVELEVQ